MSPINNNFRILGMNIGANDADYALTLNRPKVAPNETLETLLKDHKDLSERYNQIKSKIKDLKEQPIPSELKKEFFNVQKDYKEVEEKLFYVLMKEERVTIKSDDKGLARLIFDKGLDILEGRLNNSQITDLIDNNSKELTSVLKDRIKDKYGAEQLKAQYPNLHRYLRDKYNAELPESLQRNFIERIIHFFKMHFSKEYGELKISNPMAQQLQSIKDRLAENFFTAVINSPQKPAVITLQEVQSSNQIVLDILQQGNYSIVQPKTTSSQNSEREILSDTAIAFDNSRFDCLNAYAYDLKSPGDQDITAVCLKDKQTAEEFTFISLHMPGYNLEIPDDAALEEKVNRYLGQNNVSIENPEHLNKLLLEFNIIVKENEDPINLVRTKMKQKFLTAHFLNLEADLESRIHAALKNLNSAIKEIKQLNPNANVVVQGDFNTFPEYFQQQDMPDSLKKLDIFAYLKKEKNLELVRTGKPTELNLDAKFLHEREIDFALTESSLKGRVRTIEQSNQELSLVQITEDGVHFDPTLLFSDHRPVWMEVEVPGKKGPEEQA